MLSICLEVRSPCLSACSLEKTLKKATALPSVIVNCSEEEYDWTNLHISVAYEFQQLRKYSCFIFILLRFFYRSDFLDF